MGPLAHTPTPTAYSPEEAGHREVETDCVQHPKGKGMLKEVMRTGPGLGVAGEGVTEGERIELGPEPGEDLV